MDCNYLTQAYTQSDAPPPHCIKLRARQVLKKVIRNISQLSVGVRRR